MRNRRTTLRFNETEQLIIAAFATEWKLSLSEAIRRLIFWSRAPGFVLPQPSRGQAQDLSDDK
jgi:hypothetical protein